MSADRPPDARPAGPADSVVVEAVTAATATTFEELCQTPLAPGEPYHTRAEPGADRVTAEITLRRATPGRLVLAVPRAVLEVLAGRYLPGGVVLTPEIGDDAAGEFTNVIAGQTKTMLKGTPYHFNLSTPHVGSAVVPVDGTEFLVLPFECDAGGFEVRIQLAPS